MAVRLEPDRSYGLWWFNRLGHKVRQVSEPSGDDGTYHKTYEWHQKPKEEWIAVPVPDSGIPRELVDAARAAIASNRQAARAGRRFWELTGGIARCGECGWTMCATHSTTTKKGRTYAYDYYRCSNCDIALYAYTHVADEGGFDLGRFPAIGAWMERVRTQPGYIPITRS